MQAIAETALEAIAETMLDGLRGMRPALDDLRGALDGARYVYRGDRLTDRALVGRVCGPVRRADGRCIVGRSQQLVRFLDGTEAVEDDAMSATPQLALFDMADVEREAAGLPPAGAIVVERCCSDWYPKTWQVRFWEQYGGGFGAYCHHVPYGCWGEDVRCFGAEELRDTGLRWRVPSWEELVAAYTAADRHEYTESINCVNRVLPPLPLAGQDELLAQLRAHPDDLPGLPPAWWPALLPSMGVRCPLCGAEYLDTCLHDDYMLPCACHVPFNQPHMLARCSCGYRHYSWPDGTLRPGQSRLSAAWQAQLDAIVGRDKRRRKRARAEKLP